VRERGAWEAWLEFFLDGIAETANQAFETANRIASLLAEDRGRIISDADRTGSVLQVHDLMRTRPFLTAAAAVEHSGLTMPTVNAALAQLQELNLVEEITGRKRGRVFAYRAYLDVLSDGVAR